MSTGDNRVLLENGIISGKILRQKGVQGHFFMFCSYESTYAVTFYGMKIFRRVKKLLK